MWKLAKEIWQINWAYFKGFLACKGFAGMFIYFFFTFILSIESSKALAWWMRYVCSIYSVSLCRKLSGSLKITGMVILDSSWNKDGINQHMVLHLGVLTKKNCTITSERLHDSEKLTIPIHFLNMLQMLKSFLENMGAGKLVLWNS